MTLEDETGFVNVVVWKRVFDRVCGACADRIVPRRDREAPVRIGRRAHRRRSALGTGTCRPTHPSPAAGTSADEPCKRSLQALNPLTRPGRRTRTRWPPPGMLQAIPLHGNLQTIPRRCMGQGAARRRAQRHTRGRRCEGCSRAGLPVALCARPSPLVTGRLASGFGTPRIGGEKRRGVPSAHLSARSPTGRPCRSPPTSSTARCSARPPTDCRSWTASLPVLCHPSSRHRLSSLRPSNLRLANRRHSCPSPSSTPPYR